MTSQVGIGPGHRVLGRYELVRYIDSGAAGTVWEAHDHTLGQTVALKHVTFPASTPALAEEADRNRARTLREARFAAQLRNRPHVVAIYDVQEVDGDIWLVLEYLPSSSLRDVLAQTDVLDPSRVARIGAAVAEALAAAHEQGITHRDVKPGNVLLGDDGRTIKLTDFGVAHSEHERGLTSTGIVSGTPAYMAPEQARGEPCTFASDVFSLGATLYRSLEGKPPYGDDENYVALMHRVAYGTTRPPERAGTLTPLLMQLLEQDPATRPDARTAQRLLDDYARRAVDPTDPTAVAPSPPASTLGAGSGNGSGGSTGGAGGATTPPTAAPGPPGSETTSWIPPGPTAPRGGWWRRHRVPLIALGAVVVLGVAAGAVALSGGFSSDPTAVPELPDQVQPLSMSGDPATADPCRLIDPQVMSRFGGARLGPGSNTGECRVTVQTPTGQRADTDVHYSNAATEAVRASGSPRDLGGLSVVPVGQTNQGCTTYLRFADATTVGISTQRGGGSGTPADPCAITDAAVAVAVNRLNDDGVVHTPGWQGPITLAGRNACDVTGDVSTVVPGLDGQRRIGYPNGSNCYIGAGSGSELYANVTLGLEPGGTMGGYGAASTVNGKAVYTDGVTGYYGSLACRVSVVHRPSYDAGATRPTEYVAAQVEGPQPYDQLCRGATALAVQAERNAG